MPRLFDVRIRISSNQSACCASAEAQQADSSATIPSSTQFEYGTMPNKQSRSPL